MGETSNNAFDSDWYLRRHSDVAAAVNRGEIVSALDHYLAHGQAEGRQIAADPPEIILHIGPHKTGSSHIQALIGANEAALAGQGVSLSGEWKRSASDHNHTRLVDALYTRDTEALKSQVERVVLTSRERVLVSAEDLCLLPLNLLQDLGEALSRHRVTVVYYLRCWSKRLYSVWQEQVRHGYVASFKSFLAEHLVAPAGSEIINPSLCLDRFSDAFGHSSLRIISYDQLVDSEVDLYSHFVSTILSLDISKGECWGTRTHASPPFMETEIARLLNLSGTRAGYERLGMTYLDRRTAFQTTGLAELLGQYVTDIVIDTGSEPLPMLDYAFYRRYSGAMVEPRPENVFARRVVRFQSVASTCLSDPKVRLEASRLAKKVIGSLKLETA